MPVLASPVLERRAALPVDDEHAPLYSVGQVAAMLQLRQAFLRRLDEYQVVCPRRTQGGQRRYSRFEISRVQYVVELVGEGMTLTAIRRVLDLEQRVRELERRREDDARRIRELEARLRGRRATVPPM
ncbi:helix-turn-helix domain-containing protein [Spirillospora sp. NPDC048911]|uniref:helix-turn-helix domain-containing protein n=1 Tax=Spirillospora sp. NPDC048911 TaxID=3364527 RepID=UPI00371D3141